ncbi:MAG: Lrp/AsnC family transcriptional regulator [Candidatus Hermodarchaeia archaeon]|jgi:DNA-binding Lrp family transcriptional regulator
MTLRAIILIDVDPPLTDTVFDSLKDLPVVKEISSVYGIHNIFCIIEVRDEEQLNDFIFKRLRPTEGVKETLTLMISNSVRKD